MTGALALLLVLGVPASAALSVNATVNKPTVALDDQVVLSITVSADAATLPEPELPSMPRFNVHSAGRSQSMTFVNGHISNSAEYTYVLVPRLIGNAVIAPITVHAGAESAQSTPISITIVRPNEAPAQTAAPAPGHPARTRAAGGSPPVFVTAEVDKKTPFVNEQVLYTVRFHFAVPLMGNAEWSPPDTTGLLVEDLPPSAFQTALIEGRTFHVSEVKLALFPLTPGNKVVGQGTIRCQIQKGVDVDPFASDFFRQFFAAGLTMAEPVALQTKRLELAVRPLPDSGRPANFSGAVGRFNIRAEADKSAVKAGDAVNLTVTIEGTGNLKALGELQLPEMPEFRTYETVTSLNQAKDTAGVRGTKVYKTVVVPKVSGDLHIPAIAFHYFDPGTGKYVALASSPLSLRVEPGEAASTPVGFSAAPGPGAATITTLAEDIRHVHSRPGSDMIASWAALAAGAGALHAFPALLLLASGGFAAWRDNLERDPVRSRARRAARAAEERLARSRKTKSLADASSLVGESLVVYLADKLAVPPSGLTLRQAQELLHKRWPRLPRGHIDQLKRLWSEMERLRYAPATLRDTEVSQLRDAVGELLKALEEDTP